MNIGVNTRVLLKGRMEGVARYTYEILLRMVKAHPEDHFYFFFDRPLDSSFVFGDNVTPVVLFPQARHPILWYMYFEWSIPRALDKYKIDVFLSPDNSLSLRTKVPTVLVTHDIAYAHFPDHIPKGVLRYCQKNIPKFNRRADHIIAVSNASKQDLISTFGIEESKISVGHNSCPDGFKKATPEQKRSMQMKYAQGKPYVIYVGSVHPRKNVDSIVLAYDLYKKESGSNVQLVIAGRWAWKSESTRALIEDSLYRKDIHIVEHVEEGMSAIMAGAECALYISIYEGFGIPILEAMQSQVPIITSNVSSMPEVAGDAGVLVDPTDIRIISNALQKILTKKEYRQSLIQKGIHRVQDFSWDTTADIVYDRLVKVSRLNSF